MARYPLIKTILIKESPLSVEFDVTGKAPVKVIRISDKEVLVALKNVSLAKGFKVKGKNNPALESVNVETLDGNVVALVMTAKKAYGKIGSSFNNANTRLTVALEKAKPIPAPKAVKKPVVPKPASTPKKIEPPTPAELPRGEVKTTVAEQAPDVKAPPVPEPQPEPQPQPEIASNNSSKPKPKSKKEEVLKAPPVYEAPQRTRSEFQGDISDIHRGKNPMMGCDSKAVNRAVLLIKKDLYQDAYKVLDQYMFQENFACLEQAYYLKAYTYYKSIEDEDFAKLIKAQQMFQEALVSYAQSRYVPYAYAAMGMIQSRLKNSSAAEGYFNIVKKAYPDYTGMAEVEYYLATIYDERGYTDKALGMYKKVFLSPLDNSYITDAGVGYGKSLFHKRQYFDSLSVLNYVVKNDIKKVYETSDLLLYVGDASFELGLSRGARENYTRVLNLYPEVPERDMLLSKVGDAFGMENQTEKAIKIYELVRDKFPATPGFINASIGIARYLENDPEKIEIYQMVKTQFPENTYARIAMMRLAEIYQKQGEYDKCIKEIEDLLSTHPRGLRYEAVKLMQRAYEALFKEQLKNDEYTSVLNRYEQEAAKLDKMNSHLISFRVGLAYLEADLYEEAFNQLITAYKRFKRVKRPPELLYGLGVAMDESGRNDDAVKLLGAFTKRFSKDKKRPAALARIGGIYFEQNKLDKADTQFKRAYAAAKTFFEQGGILMSHSDVLEKKGDLKNAAVLRERAVKAYASAPGNHYEELAGSYKTLGNTYLDMKVYGRAADAYAKALDFSKGDRAKANLGFLLGDAYQKGNVLDKAKQTFEHVAQSYDSVWARMARQRLSTMDLAGKMINS